MLAWRGELANDEVCVSLTLAVTSRGSPLCTAPRIHVGHPTLLQANLTECQPLGEVTTFGILLFCLEWLAL